MPISAGRRARAEGLGDHPDRVDAGRLALVVGRAERGVALDVLDTAHARRRWPAGRRRRCVALQVDEVGVPAAGFALGSGHQPQRPDRAVAPACWRGRGGGTGGPGTRRPWRRVAPAPAPSARQPSRSIRPAGRSRRPAGPVRCRRARRRPGPRPSAAGPGAGCAGAPPGSSRPRRRAGRSRASRRTSPVRSSRAPDGDAGHPVVAAVATDRAAGEHPHPGRRGDLGAGGTARGARPRRRRCRRRRRAGRRRCRRRCRWWCSPRPARPGPTAYRLR